MYGILTFIYHKFELNVGKYSIHGAFGYASPAIFLKQYKQVSFIPSRLNFQGKKTWNRSGLVGHDKLALTKGLS